MLTLFEKTVDPYPATNPVVPPRGFLAFVWQGTEGMRGLIAGMILCTAVVGIFEALLFAMLGKGVDWLATIDPTHL